GCGEAKAVGASAESRSRSVETRGAHTARAQHTAKAFLKTEFHPASAAPLLARIVGPSNISSHPTSLTVFPTSTEQISEILKLAFREHWRVLPTGGATWLDPQSNSSANVIVNTSLLDQIVEHEPADLIAIAQAGVKLRDFNAKLEENGQWLPLDPPDDGRATIGGVVATGLGGPQQLGYGRPRGTVIGMRVVLADGSVINPGGRVVKNVAGYDLCKLFTGSFGTLGIITQVNFKLRPRPEREATIVTSGELPDLRSNARTILDARLFPVAAEIVSPAFAERLGIAARQNSPVLLIRFAGNEKGVSYQVEQALAKLKNADYLSNDCKLWSDIASVAFDEAIWRMGALDGNVRVAEQTELMRRVKQQLDPLGVFGTQKAQRQL
ncbi:MAG TPA: FAD-binding oxidoreductase, partial [Pyrinomonadaceae bacterium]|nr:FAD-binding oxidoreductase [Pyrinomonadaceae bacterium]